MIELRRENGSLTAKEAGVLREISRMDGGTSPSGRMSGGLGTAASGWRWKGVMPGEAVQGRSEPAIGNSTLDVERNRLLARIESVLVQSQNPKKELV